jgi:hypothetical protein
MLDRMVKTIFLIENVTQRSYRAFCNENDLNFLIRM